MTQTIIFQNKHPPEILRIMSENIFLFWHFTSFFHHHEPDLNLFFFALTLIVVIVLWAKNTNELREFDEKIMHLCLKTNTKCK